jgi:hypothetical protein
MGKIIRFDYLMIILYIVLIFFGIGFSILLFMIGIKVLKALKIYIDNNQK